MSTVILAAIAWPMAGAALGGTGARPQENSSASPGVATSLRVGFEGRLKTGHWNPVHWRLEEPWRAQGKFLEIRALDSDSIPVWYRGPLRVDSAGWAEGLAYLGRPDSSLELRLLDADEKQIAQARWQANDTADGRSTGPALGATTRVFLSLGRPLRREQIFAAGDVDAAWEFIHAAEFTGLPTWPLAYDPIDCIAWNIPSADALQGISPEQISALQQWVEGGGHLILSVSESAGELFRSEAVLAPFAPCDYVGSAAVEKSDSLEFYAQPANQLIAAADQRLPVSRFDVGNLPVEIAQDGIPLLMRKPLGFGRVSIVAFDIEQPLFAQWNGRTRFLNRVLAWDAPPNITGVTSNDLASRYGYGDLSGQLRSATEQFARVRLVTFTTIALMVSLYILCIGPGDYYFLRHVLKRMELTWLTFVLVTAAFCGLAWWIVGRTKPTEIQVNQVDVVDIDGTSSVLRGTTWANVYSPRTELWDLSLPPSTTGGIALRNRALSSFGLAGRGLGGMQINQTPLFDEPYACQLSDDQAPLLQDVPIAIASTKPLVGRWSGTHAFQGLSELRYVPRVNSLSGLVRNPLDVDLRKCFLLYGNRAYALDRIPAGGAIDVKGGVERSLKVFLQAGQGDIESARWNVADQNLAKIVEMMLFFQAAGGSNFTGLTNDFQSDVDLSPVLGLGRAVLVGRIEGRVQTPLEVNGQVAAASRDQQLTIVRIILPVTLTERSEP